MSACSNLFFPVKQRLELCKARYDNEAPIRQNWQNQNGKNNVGMKGKKMRDARGVIGKMQNSRKRQKRRKVLQMCKERRDEMTKF